ncbi:MAG: CHAT domain-containing protein, partial [Caldilineaceae bacterium]|nr:CHAT domain-containing protein [Caldilineaceae bacterium]
WLRSDGLTVGYDGPPSVVPASNADEASFPRQIIALAPDPDSLPQTPKECAHFIQLAEVAGFADAGPATRKRALLTHLEGAPYAWAHVAGHGKFDDGAPDAGADLVLAQRDTLAPEHLMGPEILGHIHATRPGFFFNACDSGRQAWTISRLGGWANRLIGSGAGLFIAPMWPVDDRAAHDFAVAFYTALFAGATVADASQMGREAARQTGDPSWLAYSVYAHPNARLAFPQPA